MRLDFLAKLARPARDRSDIPSAGASQHLKDSFVSRDRLLLLQPGFQDPKYPGETFVCPHCLAVEGLLGAAPELTSRLYIERLAFARPRPVVIAALDEAHQSLLVLILGDEHPLPEDAKSLGERRFVTDPQRILALLHERHGFPRVH